MPILTFANSIAFLRRAQSEAPPRRPLLLVAPPIRVRPLLAHPSRNPRCPFRRSPSLPSFLLSRSTSLVSSARSNSADSQSTRSPSVITAALSDIMSAESPTPPNTIVVYTDASCVGRQASGIGCYFGPAHPLNLSRPLPGPEHNSGLAEIRAVQTALSSIASWPRYRNERILIRTDYLPLVQAMQNGSGGGRFAAEYDALRRASSAFPEGVDFEHVFGHDGHPGNEEADRLARAACRLRSRSASGNGRPRHSRSRSRGRNPSAHVRGSSEGRAGGTPAADFAARLVQLAPAASYQPAPPPTAAASLPPTNSTRQSRSGSRARPNTTAPRSRTSATNSDFNHSRSRSRAPRNNSQSLSNEAHQSGQPIGSASSARRGSQPCAVSQSRADAQTRPLPQSRRVSQSRSLSQSRSVSRSHSRGRAGADVMEMDSGYLSGNESSRSDDSGS